MKYQNKQETKKSRKLLALALIAIIILGVGVGAYAYVQSRPDNVIEQSDNPDDIPKLEEADNSRDEASQINDTEAPADQLPTKVEGKTPVQYEDEKVSDTPAYDNEQFRIPEENL